MSVTIPLNRERLSAAAQPQETPARRHLQPAATPRRRAKLSPVVGATIAVALILVILVAQLGLSIAISQGAYETRALEVEQRDLQRVERVLTQNVEKLSSPQNLAENAVGLGMVQNAHPASLRLSDGAVLGDLSSNTSEVGKNLVPNATLESMPVVDADGLLVPRGTGQAVGAVDAAAAPPIPWEGKLPAPETR